MVKKKKKVILHSLSPIEFLLDMKKLIFFIIVIGILVLAAVKNPTEEEAKQRVKTEMTELINDKVESNVDTEAGMSLKQIGASIVKHIAPALVDKMIDVDVNNYIVFTTFNASSSFNDSKVSIASGIIVFGKIIPLKTDIKLF